MSLLLIAANTGGDDCATTCCDEDDCESNIADFDDGDATTEPNALTFDVSPLVWTFADSRLKGDGNAGEAIWWVPLTGGDGPLIYKVQANIYGTDSELSPYAGGLFLRGNSTGWSVRAGYDGEDFILEWTDTVAGVVRTITIGVSQPRGTLLKLWVVPRCETLAAIFLHFEDGSIVTRRVRMNAMPTYELDEVTIAPIRAGIWRGASEDTGVPDPCCPGFNRNETYTIDDSFFTDEGTYTVFGVLNWIEADSRWFGTLRWQGCGEEYFEDTWITCSGGTYKLFGTINATSVNCNSGRIEFGNVALPLLCPNLEVPLETWVFLGNGGGGGPLREFDNVKMSACGEPPDLECEPAQKHSCSGQPVPGIWLVTVPTLTAGNALIWSSSGYIADPCNECCTELAGSWELFVNRRTISAVIEKNCIWIASSGRQSEYLTDSSLTQDGYTYQSFICNSNFWPCYVDDYPSPCVVDLHCGVDGGRYTWLLLLQKMDYSPDPGVIPLAPYNKWSLAPAGPGGNGDGTGPYWIPPTYVAYQPFPYDGVSPVTLQLTETDFSSDPNWNNWQCGWPSELTIEPGGFFP